MGRPWGKVKTDTGEFCPFPELCGTRTNTVYVKQKAPAGVCSGGGFGIQFFLKTKSLLNT